MITEVKLPSGHLGMFPVVKLNTELSGEHHEMFLAAPDRLFERTLASVIGFLLDFGDVYKIAFIDLMYLFFIVRTASVGPTYKTKWVCKRTITPAGAPKQECGCDNQYTLSLPANVTKFVPPTFSYVYHDVTVDGISTRMYVRFPTVSEEFASLDSLSAKNITKEQLAEKDNAYQYAKLRVTQALTFEDARINSYDSLKREAIIKALPFTTVSALFNELADLDAYGPDLSPKKVTCTKCKGDSKLAIPFSGEFLLP